jgi:hypothetical protein
MMGYTPYNAMGNNPISFNDPEGDVLPALALIAIGAGLVNGGINVASQALKGNITNFWQGLEYFGVGAAAGVAYVVPGGGVALAGSVQAGGNKIVQIGNGQFSLDDINNAWDVAALALDVGLDFATPGLGANLGKGLARSTLLPLAEQAGWLTTVSGGGNLIRTGGAVGDIAFSVGLDEAISVTATRAGAKGLTGSIGAVAAKGVSQGFRSFSAFKRTMGPAGPGQAWHHIVEQTSGNLAKFGNQTIHNTGNLMKLPHGAGS